MINRLGLKGIALCVYAIIYSYSQDGESEYMGNLQYLCEFTGGTSKPTIIKTLKRLKEDGYIYCREEKCNSVRRPRYRANLDLVKSAVGSAAGGKEALPGAVKKINRSGKETLPGAVKNLNRGGKETLPDNITTNTVSNINDNHIDNYIINNNINKNIHSIDHSARACARENDIEEGSFGEISDVSPDEMRARGRELLGGVGKGVVMLSDEQIDDLLDRITLDEFDHYVGVVADCELTGRKYRKKTHYQAILEMAMKDRKTR